MATSRRRAAICTHGPPARAGCASIRECFFKEDEDRKREEEGVERIKDLT
jgi:hypothetical protein